MTSWPSSIWPALLLSVCVAAIGQAAEQSVPTASVQREEFFERHIRPVLVERCYKCHSAQAEKLKAGLRLDSREGLLKGGESGKPAIVPGDAGRSLLIEAIRQTNPDLKMPPPSQGAPLSARQIDDFVAWVNAGAPMPAASEVATRKSQPASRQHWAFQPPKPHPLPGVKNRAWAQTPVDLFILAKLEANGLKPSLAADPRTLIRRMTYDLTGLPPTPAEVEVFVSEFSPSRRPTFPSAPRAGEKAGKRESESAAIERLVERLLASPHYGERWGRHWLDVARYADTKGYVYAREERFFVHAWAYRDWVIQAFNDDLPYDRFLLLQIAADQLVPANSPELAAMGFITGGRRFIGVARDIIDDRIDVVTRGTMALTVQCARCHDHKYDPIPTQDYYSLYGVFHNSTERLVQVGQPPARAGALAAYDQEYQSRMTKFADTMRRRRVEANDRVRARVGDYLAAQLELNKYPEEGFDQLLTADDLIPASVHRWRDFLHQTKGGMHPIFAPWHALAALKAGEFTAGAGKALERLRREHGAELNPLVAMAFATPPESMREVAMRYGKLFASVEEGWETAVAKAREQDVPPPASLPDAVTEELRRFLNDPHSPTVVPDVGIVNNETFFPTKVCEELWKLQGEVDRWIIRTPSSPDHALVLVDGEPEPNPRVFKRGNPATKGEEVPRRFLQVVAGPNQQPFKHGSGRLELAQAIASADNSLTARVMVNRIWMHHFGAGLVRTPSDFGLRAGEPSHPELLDWLALRFVESGWSIKQMHRLILLSATYQQQCAADVSPANLARESIVKTRTAGRMPAARSIDPENRLLSHFNRQRLDFEEMRDSLLAVSGELDPQLGGRPAEMFAPANHRRSVYGLVDRQFLPGTFRVFDFANPDLHIPQRHETTVSQQALFFLNNAFIADRAKALAAQLERGLSQPAAVGGGHEGPRLRKTAFEHSQRAADWDNPRSDSADCVRFLYHALYQREPTGHELEAGLRYVATAEADQPPHPPKPLETAWRYGWGEYDEGAKRVKDFHPLPHFTGEAWQGGPEWPDGKLGWAQLTATGGHPGNDLQHACIRRWIAPQDASVAISGVLTHEPAAGDGIRAFIVSNRHGTLKFSVAHHSKADMAMEAVEVKAGDALDFVVDIRAGLNSDQFLWSPIISTLAATTGHSSQAVAKSWDAKKEFAGPAEPYAPPLKPWEQYAQVLLLANEFLFID